MTSCFELPNALVDALRAWDKSACAPMADVAGHQLTFRWHGRQSCLESLEAHEETSKTYAELRVLQKAIHVLARVVDGRVKDMRRALVASPWRRGLEALPYELVVDIVEFAALPYSYEPKELRKTMQTLLKVPGFAHCVKSAAAAVRLLKDPTAARGIVPYGVDLRSVTKFYFTVNTDPFSAISDAMKQMTSLEHLELNARFAFAALYRYNTDWIARKEILLPNLTTLSICDYKQTDNYCTPNRLEPDWSPNNNSRTVLSWVIGAFDVPKLRHVSTRLTLPAGSCSTTNGISHALDLPHLDWPVETFELKELIVKDHQRTNSVLLNDVLRFLKSARQLIIGSCDTVRYLLDWESEQMTSELTSIRLVYPDDKSLSAAATKPSQLLPQLVQACPSLKEVIVVSDNPEILQDARSIFTMSSSVTTRSILDEISL